MTLYSDSSTSPIKTSKLSQMQKDRIRKSHIHSSHFDPNWIGEGGPIELYQHCGFVNNNYREGYDEINWNLKQETL